MTRQLIIDRTLKAISQLPDDKAEEISDFADFIIKRYEEDKINEGLRVLTEESHAFEFLNSEEEVYSETDLKEVYNAKG